MNVLRLMLAILFFANVSTSSSQTPRDSEAIKESFKVLANNVASQRPWRDGTPSIPKDQILQQLEQLSKELMMQPDYASAMLDLLNDYSNQDGYPRQKLLDAIFTTTRSQLSDVPFFKNALLASLNFTFENYPDGTSKFWHSSTRVRDSLAWKILVASNQGSLFDNPDRTLLNSNPRGWLVKYAP